MPNVAMSKNEQNGDVGSYWPVQTFLPRKTCPASHRLQNRGSASANHAPDVPVGLYPKGCFWGHIVFDNPRRFGSSTARIAKRSSKVVLGSWHGIASWHVSGQSAAVSGKTGLNLHSCFSASDMVWPLVEQCFRVCPHGMGNREDASSIGNAILLMPRKPSKYQCQELGLAELQHIFDSLPSTFFSYSCSLGLSMQHIPKSQRKLRACFLCD